MPFTNNRDSSQTGAGGELDANEELLVQSLDSLSTSGASQAVRKASSTTVANVDLGSGNSTVSINLTDAQIKALSSSPVTVLAAQGANTVIQVLQVFIALDNAAGVYTDGGTVRLTINNEVIATVCASGFLTADASASKGSWNVSSITVGTAAMVNQPLKITAAADFTGGNAANKATLIVTYRVLTTLPA